MQTKVVRAAKSATRYLLVVLVAAIGFSNAGEAASRLLYVPPAKLKQICCPLLARILTPGLSKRRRVM